MTTTHVPTEIFARQLGLKPSTVRRGLCVNGHYLNVRPVKLPNGRLLWPVKALDGLLGVEDSDHAA